MNHNICKLSSTDRQHPAILLDFGKELQGGLQIVTGMPASHEPVAVRIRLGESVSEAMCDIDGVNGASNDHAMRDFTIRLPWLGVMEVGNSGFRFARIDLLDDSVELHIKEIRAISVFRDIPYKGSFRCNDERLNRIWQTGAYPQVAHRRRDGEGFPSRHAAGNIFSQVSLPTEPSEVRLWRVW